MEENELLKEFENVHITSGPIYQKILRYKALKCLKQNQIDGVYYLMESHVPGLRNKATLRYVNALQSNENQYLPLNKEYLVSPCSKFDIFEKVSEMLNKVEKMPKEWTVIQLTPQCDGSACFQNGDQTSSPLHISVFNCGQKEMRPFCVTIPEPRDKINGKKINLFKEMFSLLRLHQDTLQSTENCERFTSAAQKQRYLSERKSVDMKFKRMVKDIQDIWLGPWRCLMTGKFMDENIDENIAFELKTFFKNELPELKLTNVAQQILCSLIKSIKYITIKEIGVILSYLFDKDENKNVIKRVYQAVRTIFEKIVQSDLKKHPIILVLDDTLDFYPWEMIDLLQCQAVSRVPSLHILFALFEHHKDSIEGGYKLLTDYKNGRYLINPESNLPKMEKRMSNFLEYWLPEWKGFIGRQPNHAEYEEMLTTGDIFSYFGHGSGAHLFSSEKLIKTRVKSVVLLFGCSSSSYNIMGPQVESYGVSQTYFIVCCPCILGMLWSVSDLDTDLLATYFLSRWLPSPGKDDWNTIDKKNWYKGASGPLQASKRNEQMTQEPDLLRALISAKDEVHYYVTKSACVVRGLPIKLANVLKK